MTLGGENENVKVIKKALAAMLALESCYGSGDGE